MNKKLTVALAGNPNVGKSTVFNTLTGLKQHTGNWTGKTVENARGTAVHNGREYDIMDLPGIYSLTADSAEEEVAREYLCSGAPDIVAVVADATALERNLNLLLQIMELTPHVVLCLNLMDEARKKQIVINDKKLAEILGIEVVTLSARNKNEVWSILAAVDRAYEKKCRRQGEGEQCDGQCEPDGSMEHATAVIRECERIAKETVTFLNPDYTERDRKIDKVLTSKLFGIPIMLALLGAVFFITITLANYPSQLLAWGFGFIEKQLNALLNLIHTPWFIQKPLMDGIYRTTAWVVAVMLPPMAIFFPLFTLLEDLGYLPRVAFNLDKPFKKCGCCGKQCLSMCMGFGCNAAGVVGCRIINSPRERLIAILTNNFVPCNGRFPTLITVAGVFIGGVTANALLGGLLSALTLTLLILAGITATFAVSMLLSKTLLKGVPSAFSLELPPFRRPQIGKILLRSLLDRTIFVLGRALIVAVPSGLVIWLLANITVGGNPLIYYAARSLDPLGRLMGMDGYILTAFVLSFPANEIFLPVAVLSYTASSSLSEIENISALSAILKQNGWTTVTAISAMLFTLFHFPCATTCLTIKKETKSLKWTALAIALPTVLGIIVCIIFTAVMRLFGWG